MAENSPGPEGATVHVYAAGSLRYAVPALVSAFSEATGIIVDTRHGPAGLLRERIEAGDRPDLFLSADAHHPLRLAELSLAHAPTVFARNTLAAVARRQAQVTEATFIERVLDPAIAIGTSTPRSDPSGDYAWAVFRKIEEIRPGAFTMLDAKAKKLLGSALPAATSAPVAASYDPVSQALESGVVDIFIGYLTGLKILAADLATVEIVPIPSHVNVVPDYAMAAIAGCRAEGHAFARFILSPTGQLALQAHGFTPVSPSISSPAGRAPP